jgi:hypothetical protein
MTLMEAVMASLVLMLATTTAGQLWSQGLRISSRVAQREEQLHSLDALLLASEGLARELAAMQGPISDCQEAVGHLTVQLRALPHAPQITLSFPASPPGTLHVRWEVDGLRRERLLSASTLRLCQEASHAS